MRSSALFTSIFLCAALLLLNGCGGGPTETDHHGKPHGGPVVVSKTHTGKYPISIVCTTGMIVDLVREIGGEDVQITQLMGEGTDPHQYKASPGDVAVLSKADLILYSGLHLEGKMSDLFAGMARRKPTFAVCEYLDPKKVIQTDAEAYDPHVWFDVSLWSDVAGIVNEILSGFDPKHAEQYAERCNSLRQDLAKLHTEVKQQIAGITKEQRVLVTAHDAFRYFGRAYEIEVKGIQGISTESEAGVKEINELVEFISRKKIKAVFVESSVSERNIQALLEGCKARNHVVKIGGELFSDAMGKVGTPEGTYKGMVRHNVSTITKSLK